MHGFDVAGPPVATYRSHPSWVIPATGAFPVPLPQRSNEWRQLTQDTLDQVVATAARLDGDRIATPESSSDLAVHRFTLGCSRAAPVDALLDFVIALEALLLPYDAETRTGDLSYRFRAHGAVYLAPSVLERTETWKQLQALYNLRSRAVHGQAYPSGTEVHDATATARRLAAHGLLRAVHDGFPDPPAFRKLLLD